MGISSFARRSTLRNDSAGHRLEDGSLCLTLSGVRLVCIVNSSFKDRIGGNAHRCGQEKVSVHVEKRIRDHVKQRRRYRFG